MIVGKQYIELYEVSKKNNKQQEHPLRKKQHNNTNQMF